MQNMQSSLSSHLAVEQQRLITGLTLLALGVIVILSVGFLGPDAIHNAAHDARHALAFPCH